jgi:hypothetical protein
MLDALETGVQRLGQPMPALVSAKPKFGDLRLSLASDDPSLQAIIRSTETAASRSCSLCGEPGSKVNRPEGVLVMCSIHDGPGGYAELNRRLFL